MNRVLRFINPEWCGRLLKRDIRGDCAMIFQSFEMTRHSEHLLKAFKIGRRFAKEKTKRKKPKKEVRLIMKMKFASLLVAVVVGFATLITAARNIKTLNIFPWTPVEVHVPLYFGDLESMCLPDVVGTICEVNQDAGTYRFVFKVWKPSGELAGKALARTVVVTE